MSVLINITEAKASTPVWCWVGSESMLWLRRWSGDTHSSTDHSSEPDSIWDTSSGWSHHCVRRCTPLLHYNYDRNSGNIKTSTAHAFKVGLQLAFRASIHFVHVKCNCLQTVGFQSRLMGLKWMNFLALYFWSYLKTFLWL